MQSDDKSTSTVNTQADIIDNLKQKMQKLEHQLASLQKQVHSNQDSSTKTTIPPTTQYNARESLLALETQVTTMMEQQHQYFSSLHTKTEQAINFQQQQTTEQISNL